MWQRLTPRQEAERLACREFVEREITPHAARFDREQRIPPALIQTLAARGYLGAPLPAESGGGGKDMLTYGLINEEIGRGCSSVRSLLTVHDMVGRAIARWGAKAQKAYWLPKLASGQTVAAFALTEPSVGSDARRVETSAVLQGDSYVLNGEKRWITSGQIADLFLVFAQSEGQPVAFLVERDTAGLSLTPTTELLGTRASMLAELHLKDCHVPAENVVGKVGLGFSHVASVALDQGRYSVACGCVGIAQACLEACLEYTSQRQQFGSLLRDHQLIRRMISDMATNLRAARLLCLHAGYLKDDGDPGAAVETQIAKYFAARAATQAASDAVQIHGANGCSPDYPVARYYRDAKVMEIIEGSNEIQQLTIAEHIYHGF
jgi:glutaryl-CoA dehydrogenase (non-decarboxylating)